ncbi:MAG: hypothetical protein Q7R94_01080 [bacterium]|nr:hypothetical protein [bacterium]
MAKFKYYFQKLLAMLRVRSSIGGLEISDLVFRFSYFDGKAWHLHGVRLEPGIMEAGKVKNYDKFVEVLKTLKSQAFANKDVKRRVNIIASLSSVNIYSQVFSLPIIAGENLDKAIQLNIQMVSPIDAAQAYSGWQKVGEDQRSLRLEILSAFIDRPTVDEISRGLLAAGFLAVAIEPRALALARVLKDAGVGFDTNRAYIMVSLDNSSLDFLIIRRGQLYFEYFNSWRDISDENGKILTSAFEATVTRSLHQVLNFYNQHWPEPISEVKLAATALRAETEKIIRDNFSLQISNLELSLDQSIGPEWFVALGCGLRGLMPRKQDKEMSLLGIGAEDEFRHEQAINFMEFWRLAMPISLGVLLISFFLADLFLIQTRRSLETQSLFNVSPEQAKENQILEDQAKEFNRNVALISSIQKSATIKSDFWTKVHGLMSASGVTASRFSFQSPDAPISLSGEAASPDQISNFKKALEGDPAFQNINLPLDQIKSGPQGVTFSMTFWAKP